MSKIILQWFWQFVRELRVPVADGALEGPVATGGSDDDDGSGQESGEGGGANNNSSGNNNDAAWEALEAAEDNDAALEALEAFVGSDEDEIEVPPQKEREVMNLI